MGVRKLTILDASGVAERETGNVALLEKPCHIAGHWRDRHHVFGEVGWLGMQSKMAHPEVRVYEGTDRCIYNGRALFSWYTESNIIVAIISTSIQTEVAANPQAVKAL